MAKNITPAQMAQKWNNGVSAGGQNWVNGVNNTVKNPMALAAAQVQTFQANFNAAVPRWAQAMAQANVGDWKAACAAQVQKYTMGAAKGMNKYTKFANKAMPVYAAMRQAADNAANNPIAKVTAALQVLLAAGRKQGGNAFV